ncbi:hypothetical protein SAMN05421749_10590 [Acinetobacter marinus]|uniref:Uncharacterized protein n=1 Tax=Acinetobacter marinus TaxID=281375 RepID=A0A1G6LK96_9GAMM|nr:hypothetical protein [Acinetobacter marinus]SDC43437.1 hypothetical protein SAMN05421749_10590 [Acinetobacter marinus]
MTNLKYAPVLILPLTFGAPMWAMANEEVVALPTITVMAEDELRDEFVGILPYQEEAETKAALQYHIYKLENDIQNTSANGSTSLAYSYQPMTAMPNMNQYSPALSMYIMSVASGLQSADPTNGLFNMLAPLNINRGNIDAIREGTLQINMNDALRLQQQLQKGLNGY